MRRAPVLALLLWVCALFCVGIALFLGGFLLVRVEVSRSSSCADALSPGAPRGGFCEGAPRFRRAVLLVLDALSFAFARHDPRRAAPRPCENKLGVLSELAAARPAHARLYPFRADPPTTTMQRIKGFTTGSLPTFVDVGNNFASSAILEDNLIHQLGQNGRRVVFMGDDTWESLFPGRFHRCLPFPSFNVKDLHTVDNGILQHLYPTMEGGDWDVLIAHFLGVDHCGHRFGPDHPAMAAKLTQMDQVIRDVIGRLQNDTLLVVMGDHGMTDTGDHGGESLKETDAALFLYSPSQLFPPSEGQAEPEVIPQTDLVPTLALLLGIPIPYSNIGQVISLLFTRDALANGTSAQLAEAQALWINAKQVNRFLDTYSQIAKDLPLESLARLRGEFSLLSAEYSALLGANPTSPTSPEFAPRLKELLSSLRSYLSEVRETCRASWARFHPLKMASGVAVLAATCLLCCAISELAGVIGRGDWNPLWTSVVLGTVAGGSVAVWQLVFYSQVDLLWALCGAALVSQLAFFWKAYQMNRNGTSKKAKPIPRALLRGLSDLSVPLCILLLRCASLFSDSYVIAEGRVATFLLFTLGVSIPVRLNWDGQLLSLMPDTQKPYPSQSSIRRESLTLLGCLGFLVVSLYLSLSFHGCREEQGSCEPSPFLAPLSRIQDGQLRNLRYFLSVASLVAWAYLVRSWLRHYGNLNSPSPAVFTARWVLPLVTMSVVMYWAVSSTPEESFRNLQELIGLSLLVLPRAAYALLGTGVALVLLNPLTVYLKPRQASPSSMVPPRYRASTGVSPQAELHHLIPQIYQRMRRSLEEEVTGQEGDGRPAVEAYGLGTVYSAPLLLVSGLLGLGLAMLHPEGMALSFLLLLLESAAILYMHSAASSLAAPGDHTDGFWVPWAPVLMWALAATQFFHSTGHLPTFPSIQWNSAFVGFNQSHAGALLPGLLVAANTFSAQILLAVSCPLLLFWPLVRESRGNRRARGAQGDDEAVMEMKLRENPEGFSAALLQLGMRFLLVHGVQLLASVCAAAVLRRHLMVWKVFAPKLMFEAFGFLVTSLFVLLGFAFVMRVDVAVTGWFKRLVPDLSR
ncbi:GPI ethanolamine phosphate transferase 3 isoform X1 [Lepisosteus oculatus]|uniref:GPI ethanolamine phosphate transferase 3 isoform X1 n=2 Tax=Lepisosteus oculatus TaxID=7918 RepID=UPI00371BC893